MKRILWGIGFCAILFARGAKAEDRPAEDDMFGEGGESGTGTTTGTGTGTTTGTGTATTTATTTTTGSEIDSRDSLNLSDPKAGTRFSADVAPEDPLKIGGQLYWRVMSSGRQGQYPQNWSLSAPALLDVFMDARPNERVRGFALGRMSYDPTLPPNGTTSTTTLSGGSAQGSDSLSSIFGQQTRGPYAVLDQLWLRFDLLHTVFVTAGKQHVRWGTAHFWTPTDYLHLQARNPLLPFDPRTGTTMLKLHVPWEARGWNFYAYALPESATTTSTTGDIAGAARAEIVLGTFEAGAGVFGRRNSKPKFAADFSAGIWDLDFYGEAALRNASDVSMVSYVSQAELSKAQADVVSKVATSISKGDLSTVLPAAVEDFYPTTHGSGWKPQVTGGVSYTRQYADKDTFTVGVEYFYNGLGYANADVYPGLILPRNTALSNPATFFYLGRHYLAVFATAPAPYSWDNTTFTLSALSNLSDKSGIARLDYSLIVLTHVRLEAYGAVHFGERNGEYRFGIDGKSILQAGSDLTLQTIGNQFTFAPTLFDFGVGLRVAL
jgi:hypothetical protein